MTVYRSEENIEKVKKAPSKTDCSSEKDFPVKGGQSFKLHNSDKSG